MSKIVDYANCRAEFTKQLSSLMREKGVKLSDMERELDLNHSTVHHWLIGDRSPQIEYLCLLADYFNCSVDYLLGRKDY